MAEIGSVTVAVSVEPTEEFDAAARALGYVKERTCRIVDEYVDLAPTYIRKFGRCDQCGESIEANHKYCSNCGARVEGAGE